MARKSVKYSILAKILAVLMLLDGFLVGLAPQARADGNWVEVQPAGDFDKEWLAVASDDDGSNLIAVEYFGRVYTSSNYGATWTERRPVGDSDEYWLSIASDADGSHLVAIRDDDAAYVSLDYGATWTRREITSEVGYSLSFPSIDMDSDGSFLIAGSVTAGADGGRLFTSSDYGVTWTERQPAGDSDEEWQSVACDSDGSNLIVGNFGGRVYTSSNYGVGWVDSQPNGNFDNFWYAVDSDADGSNLIISYRVESGTGNTAVSYNYGVDWTVVNVPPLFGGSWNVEKVISDSDGSNLYVVAYEYDVVNRVYIYESSDYGANWAEIYPAGFLFAESYAFASDSDGSNLIAAYFNDGVTEGTGRIYVGSPVTNDTTLNNVITMSRLQKSVSSTFALSFELQNTLSTSLYVAFPEDFVVTGAFTSGTCTSGTISNFDYDATSLYADKSFCSGTVTLTGATVTNPSTAGEYEITWENDDPGSATVYILDDDTITVTADVTATFVFDLMVAADEASCATNTTTSDYALDIGVLTPGTAKTATEAICLKLSTNAEEGAEVQVKSLYGALRNAAAGNYELTSAAENLASGGGADGEGYGLCGSSSADNGPSGNIDVASYAYATACSTVGAVSGSWALVADTDTEPVAGGSVANYYNAVTLEVAALASTVSPSGDYTDDLTFRAYATF